MSDALLRRIADNLARVRENIAAAAARSGRSAAQVRLVGVTKYGDAATARLLVEAGCHDLGESRPQELWSKAAHFETDRSDPTAPPDRSPAIRWHLIGHLQRNKLARTLPLVTLIHSVDSERLLEAIAAIACPTPVNVLLEVNISGDAAKHGFAPDELPRIVPHWTTSPLLRIRGLMAMSGLESSPEETRREFAAVRALRDRLRDLLGSEVKSNESPLPELSMGMSGDYEIAIEEGATIVRVGSALFEGCLTQ